MTAGGNASMTEINMQTMNMKLHRESTEFENHATAFTVVLSFAQCHTSTPPSAVYGDPLKHVHP